MGVGREGGRGQKKIEARRVWGQLWAKIGTGRAQSQPEGEGRERGGNGRTTTGGRGLGGVPSESVCLFRLLNPRPRTPPGAPPRSPDGQLLARLGVKVGRERLVGPLAHLGPHLEGTRFLRI